MGLVHLEHMARRARAGKVELVALGDRHAPTLLHALERLASWQPDGTLPTAFDRPEAMAQAAQLDACVVASRTGDHTRDTLAFVQHRVRVLVEKPLAGSMDEAAQFCEALGDAGQQMVQLAFQRHYDAAAQAATCWFDSGRIGALQQSHHVLQDKNPTPANYQSSGITADMAIHLIFEAMSFHGFELPSQVQALRFLAPHYADRAGEGANVVHAFLRWADGSLAHLWGSRINNTGYDNGFKLIGTKGRIDVGEFVGEFGPVTARLWTGTDDSLGARGTLAESLEFPMCKSAADHPDFYARYGAAYAAEFDALLASSRDGGSCQPGPEIGWKTQLIAELAECSSRAGGRLFEPVMPDGSAIRDAAAAESFLARAAQ